MKTLGKPTCNYVGLHGTRSSVEEKCSRNLAGSTASPCGSLHNLVVKALQMPDRSTAGFAVYRVRIEHCKYERATADHQKKKHAHTHTHTHNFKIWSLVQQPSDMWQFWEFKGLTPRSQSRVLQKAARKHHVKTYLLNAVVSRNRGPQYTPQHTIVLAMGPHT